MYNYYIDTTWGHANVTIIAKNIPLIKEAAANIPAVGA